MLSLIGCGVNLVDRLTTQVLLLACSIGTATTTLAAVAFTCVCVVDPPVDPCPPLCRSP